MKKWDWDYFVVWILVVCLFFSAFLLGYNAGKDVTSFNFEGLPDDAVIHFEVDKGGDTQ